MVAVSFRKILVAVDESAVSDQAFAAAVAMAKALDAKLTITYVLDPYSLHRDPQRTYLHSISATTSVDDATREKFEREWLNYVKYYESMLSQKTDEAIAAGVEADFIHPHGSPGSVLCEVARTYDIDLMVIGSHQRKGMAEIMLGSTSNYITHHAPCSVLVVHSNAERESMSNEEMQDVERSIAMA